MRVAKSSFRAAARAWFSPSADQLPADPRGVVTRHAGRASSRSSTTRSHCPSSARPGGNRDAAEINRRCRYRPSGSASSPTCRRSNCTPTPRSTRWLMPGSSRRYRRHRDPGETPMTVVHYLGLTPKWIDGTRVGGYSFMIHVRHAVAAIASGLCETVLITHGESGRSGVGRSRNVVGPTSLGGQFEQSRMGRWGRRLWRRPLLHAFRHGRRACAICAGPPSPKSPTPRSRSTTVWAACSPQAALSSCRTRCPRPWCIIGIPKLAILT